MKPKTKLVKKFELISKVYTSPELNVLNGIASFSFKNIYSLQQSLVRPHIFYEKSALNGQLRGVNFPSKDYTEWIQSISQDQLTLEEINIVELLQQNSRLEPNSTSYQISDNITYILAYIKGDISTYNHESAHALFHTFPDYATLCTDQYTSLTPEIKSYINKELKIRGYVESNYIDEFQAYIYEGPGELGKKFIIELGMTHQVLKEAIKSLNLV